MANKDKNLEYVPTKSENNIKQAKLEVQQAKAWLAAAKHNYKVAKRAAKIDAWIESIDKDIANVKRTKR